MERVVPCTYAGSLNEGGAGAVPARGRSFYENFALVLLYSILALVDAIQQLNLLIPILVHSHSSPSVRSSVPVQVPLIAAGVQSVISFAGATQASAALLYTAHPAHAAALWRILYCLLAVYCVAAQCASQACSASPEADSVLAALAVAALRGTVLAAPADLGARADWPAAEPHARTHLACAACFFAACCVLTGGLCSAAAATGTATATTTTTYGSSGRLPLIAIFVGLLFAFWAAAGSIICYSRSQRAARAHAVAAVIVCALCIAAFSCLPPVFHRTSSLATLGIGPESATCLFFGAILLPCVYMAEQARCDREKAPDNPDEIVINYP